MFLSINLKHPTWDNGKMVLSLLVVSCRWNIRKQVGTGILLWIFFRFGHNKNKLLVQLPPLGNPSGHYINLCVYHNTISHGSRKQTYIKWKLITFFLYFSFKHRLSVLIRILSFRVLMSTHYQCWTKIRKITLLL